MIKALISILVVVLVLYGAFELWSYWDRVNHDRDLADQKAAEALQINGDRLAGMPGGLETSYKASVAGGPAQVRNWLKLYGQTVQDPRRAWIELDYMITIAHDEPVEAKKIFAEVQSRVTESSPVYPRIKQLEKTYQ